MTPANRSSGSSSVLEGSGPDLHQPAESRLVRVQARVLAGDRVDVDADQPPPDGVDGGQADLTRPAAQLEQRPSGASRASSAAHCDCWKVQGRGRSTRSSYAMRSGPKSTVVVMMPESMP